MNYNKNHLVYGWRSKPKKKIEKRHEKIDLVSVFLILLLAIVVILFYLRG